MTYCESKYHEDKYGTIFDPVQKPAHYVEDRKYEPIDVIEDWKLNFHLGNAMKYIARAGRKTDEREDVSKAVWYLTRYLSKELK